MIILLYLIRLLTVTTNVARGFSLRVGAINLAIGYFPYWTGFKLQFVNKELNEVLLHKYMIHEQGIGLRLMLFKMGIELSFMNVIEIKKVTLR